MFAGLAKQGIVFFTLQSLSVSSQYMCCSRQGRGNVIMLTCLPYCYMYPHKSINGSNLQHKVNWTLSFPLSAKQIVQVHGYTDAQVQYYNLSSFSLYVEEKLGTKYVEKRTIPFEISYKESGPATPVFFVLSPGVDPLKDVEALGNKMNFTVDNKNFHNVSLGQVRRERERRERGREETEKRKKIIICL